MIRAGIVGLGWWGRNLVNAVAGGEAVRFVKAHTRNAETAAEFCRERSLLWVGDLDAILGDADLDAVVFATPHTLHGEEMRRAAAAGKAVFVEKPFTLSLADARASVAAVEKAGVVLAVGYNRRFHPSMQRLREEMREERLGTIATVIGEQTSLAGLALSPDAWRARPEETPAGAMTQIGVHLLDGMIDLVGRVREVSCLVERRAASEGADTTCVLLSFENGTTGHLFCSTVARPHYRMALYGTKGLGEVLGHQMGTFRLLPASSGAAETVETPSFNMLTAELEAFARAVEGKAPFPTPIGEILHGVAVFEAVVQSAATGRKATVAANA